MLEVVPEHGLSHHPLNFNLTSINLLLAFCEVIFQCKWNQCRVMDFLEGAQKVLVFKSPQFWQGGTYWTSISSQVYISLWLPYSTTATVWSWYSTLLSESSCWRIPENFLSAKTELAHSRTIKSRWSEGAIPSGFSDSQDRLDVVFSNSNFF